MWNIKDWCFLQNSKSMHCVYKRECMRVESDEIYAHLMEYILKVGRDCVYLHTNISGRVLQYAYVYNSIWEILNPPYSIAKGNVCF